MIQPTDSQIIRHAQKLLGSGILASGLPAQLMEEFGLSRERALRLAQEALKRQTG